MHNPRLGVTSVQFSSVQSLSPDWFFGTSRTAAHQLQELAQTHVHWVRDAIQSSHPLSFLSLAFNLSRIRVFSNESVLLIRWPKYWSFSFSISPSNEYSGLISFRMDWFDHLAVQRTLKSLLQHHSSKASILRHSAFFMVQLSHPYMTTGKTIALTRQIIVGKIMTLLFNVLSRFVVDFLPRSKRLLISWLQSPSAVILEPQKSSLSLFPHLSLMKWWEQMSWSLFFECWVLSQLFHSPLSPSSRGSLVPLHHKGDVICISEIIDISLGSQSWFQIVLHLAWHFAWCTLHIN